MVNADFQNAFLIYANLVNADFQNATLTGADLTGILRPCLNNSLCE